MLLSYLKADFMKTKHLSIRTAHILIPLITAGVFIAYYSYVPWNDYTKVDGYYQVLGTALPFLIGLFCAVLAEQEQSVGYFQMMLMVPKKQLPFLSKLILLLSFGFGALVMASMLFGIAFRYVLCKVAVSVWFHILAALIIFESSIPMYILHLYLSFRFNKGVSIGWGVVESLVSALFLTGMGDSVWKFVPAVWPTRYVSTFLAVYTGKIPDAAYTELKQAGGMGVLVIAVGLILYLLWASRWEGSRIGD